jgi:hypothetical protein
VRVCVCASVSVAMACAHLCVCVCVRAHACVGCMYVLVVELICLCTTLAES